jgi:hypothetical protein
LALLAVTYARAQSGHWEGVVQTPNGDRQVIVDLARSAAGEWKGALTAPEEDIKDVPLEQIAVQESRVKFTLNSTRGHITFDGSASADGKTLSGTISAMGQEMPCKMTQAGEAKH